MTTLRTRIADAAQELYLREGIEGFSMRKVADLVGVSAPAIYRYYKSKDELLDEIVIEGLKVLERYLQPALEADNPYGKLVLLTDNYLKFALEQPKYFDFAFLVPNRDMSGLAEEVANPMWTIFRLAIAQVGACMEEGLFRRDDPLGTAIIIWAEAHGLVTLFRTGRFGQQSEAFTEIYRHSIERVMQGLKP